MDQVVVDQVLKTSFKDLQVVERFHGGKLIQVRMMDLRNLQPKVHITFAHVCGLVQ
jgi:hypothetical protein